MLKTRLENSESIPTATTKRRSPGASFALLASAGASCVVGLSCLPQLRLCSIYAFGMAVLLLVCSAAAWRARYLSPVPTIRQMARSIGLAQCLLTALVWAHPVSLHVYAGVAAVIVGDWPSYGQPDPRSLQLPVLHLAVATGFYVSALAALAWAVCFPLCARVQSWRSVRWHTIFFAVGVGVFWVSLFLDPLGALNWYAD